MEEFLNVKYQLTEAENFNDLLLFLGKNYFERKLAAAFKPVQCLTRTEDGTYTFHYYSTLINYDIVFVPGVEFVEIKPDRTEFKSILVIEGNKLIHNETDKRGRTLKHVYEFYPDKMVATTTAKELEKPVTRHYVLVK